MLTDKRDVPTNFISQIIEDDLKSGKHRVIHTRFPPEPNGYLHLGHAKSLCLNFGLAKDFGGTCNLRFDDTNPAKEEIEYINGIQNDIKWLGFDWGDNLFYASDYFQRLYDDAVKLIKKGLAFVDKQTPEQVAATRGDINTPGTNSPYRDQSIEEALELFEGMKNGTYRDYVLRAKIDMAHSNPLLRDPLMYRYKEECHPRTGDEWHIYPLYDYAHGQSDSYENITHSICTLEFIVHRPLYEWFQEKLEITQTRQIEFARLNLTNVVMSKRKLMRLVNDNIVRGWDDPRMPTICGMRRRGYTPEGIKDFCARVGVAKRENLLNFDLLEHCVRESVDDVIRRFIITDPLKVTITNYDKESEEIEAANNPKDAKCGSRPVTFSKEVFIDKSDFMETPPSDWHRLAPGVEVRLRWAYWIKCEEVIKNSDGDIVEIKATYDPATKGVNKAEDGRKVKGTIHWLSSEDAMEAELRLYDKMFTEDLPEENIDWINSVNPDSLIVKNGLIEKCIPETLKTHKHIQAERVGFFVEDLDSTPEKIVLNRALKLQETYEKTVKTEAVAKKQQDADARAKAAAERAKVKAEREARKAAKKSKKSDASPPASPDGP